MGVSRGDAGLSASHDRCWSDEDGYQRRFMKTTIKGAIPWLAAAVFGAGIALAPIASAAVPSSDTAGTPAAGTGTDPSVPYGTNPMSPYIFGYHTWLGDNEGVPF
jgi:hypothetical protein